jgi:hypothetical protein
MSLPLWGIWQVGSRIVSAQEIALKSLSATSCNSVLLHTRHSVIRKISEIRAYSFEKANRLWIPGGDQRAKTGQLLNRFSVLFPWANPFDSGFA